MGKVDLIIVLSKGMGECERVIASSETVALAFEAVLVVADVSTHAMPRQLLWPIARYLRKTEHSHSFVVQRVRLGKVQDVKLDRVIFLCVAHPEKEPLRVPIGVDVIGKDKVILVVTHLHGAQ